MEEIIVTIQGGDVKVEVEGVKGARCLELTQAIEELIGKNISRHLKDDFYGLVKLVQTVGIKPIGKKERGTP